MAKQNYRCAGCGTRIDPGITSNNIKAKGIVLRAHPYLTSLCFCCLSLPQTILSGYVTVNTSAGTSASAVMKTLRLWFPAGC